MDTLDTNILIAIKCPNCGRMNFHNISLFKLFHSLKSDLCCSCGKREASVSLKDNKTMIIDISCLVCGVNHTYIYSLKDLLKRKVTVICCDDTGFELCFMGREKDVRNLVSKYQENLYLLLGELGFITEGDDFIKGKTNRKN